MIFCMIFRKSKKKKKVGLVDFYDEELKVRNQYEL